MRTIRLFIAILSLMASLNVQASCYEVFVTLVSDNSQLLPSYRQSYRQHFGKKYIKRGYIKTDLVEFLSIADNPLANKLFQSKKNSSPDLWLGIDKILFDVSLKIPRVRTVDIGNHQFINGTSLKNAEIIVKKVNNGVIYDVIPNEGEFADHVIQIKWEKPNLGDFEDHFAYERISSQGLISIRTVSQDEASAAAVAKFITIGHKVRKAQTRVSAVEVSGSL